MRNRPTLIVVLPLILLLVAAPINIAGAQPDADRFGVSVVVENAADFDTDFAAMLESALPSEWIAPPGTVPRFEAHAIVALDTSTCQYINAGDITLKRYGIQATVIDAATGEQVAAKSFEAQLLACPSQLGDPDTSYPSAIAFQQWVIGVLAGKGGLPDPLQPLLTLTLEWPLRAAQLRPDGAQILVGLESAVQFYDVSTGAKTFNAWYTGGPTYSPDGESVVAASAYQPLTVWDSGTGAVRFTIEGTTLYPSFSPDAKMLAGVVDLQRVQLWDAQTGAELRSFDAVDIIWSLQFSADGQYLLVQVGQRQELWDVQTGEPALSLDVFSLTLSPDSRQALTWIYTEPTATLLDVAAAQPTGQLTGHTGNLYLAEYAPDGRQIVTAAEDHTVRLWDAATGEEIRRWTLDYNPAVALSPDGRLLFTFHSARTEITVWDLLKGAEVGRIGGLAQGVNALDFSQDGRRLLTIGLISKTLRVWDIGFLYDRLE